MKFLYEKNNFDNYIYLILSLIVIFFFYFKFYLFHEVPATGDELSAILVYSSNIKTLFTKNYPNNVTLFHLIGYIKTIFLGYDLLTFRTISFFFVLTHLLILKKLKFKRSEILIYSSIILLTTFVLQGSLYIGYAFSSFVFCIIFYYLKRNNIDRYNKIIFILLFIQTYNHLINLYFVIPILIVLFVSLEKKIFIRNFLLFFFFPTFLFYLFSISLTGIALMKISDTSFSYVIIFFLNNLTEIFINGFKGIFFYKAYSTANAFDIKTFLITLYNFDKIIFFIMLFSLVTSVLNFKYYEKSYLYLIVFLHIVTIIIINKNPAPRIFAGFAPFYLLIVFDYFRNSIFKQFQNYKIIKYIILLIPFFLILNTDFEKKINKSSYGRDITYIADEYSKKLLKNNCTLINYDFIEIQKRNYYFNYLNICKKKFNLSEFLNFYRS